MEELSMSACASQPGGNGGLLVAEDPFGSGWVQPFGQRRQHHCDLMRRCFQTIQGRVASSSERGVAGLTTKRLDPLGMSVLPIADENMDVSVSDSKVGRCWLGQAKPSVGICLGARRLFTSRQGRTGCGAGPLAEEAGEARRQAGQSSGQRGLSRRGSLLRSLPAVLDGAGPRWGQPRAHSSARETMSKHTSRNTCKFMEHSLCLRMSRRDCFLPRR